MTATNSGRPCIRRRVSWAWNHPPSTVLINPIIPCQTHKQQLSSPRHTLSPWPIHGSCRAREEHGYGSWRCPSHPASCQGHTRKLWALPHQGVLTQETNVSTRRHLQVPLSWKVPVSPCPWACPMGRGGWLEGTWGSRAAPQKRPEGGRNSGGSWGGGLPLPGCGLPHRQGPWGPRSVERRAAVGVTPAASGAYLPDVCFL